MTRRSALLDAHGRSLSVDDGKQTTTRPPGADPCAWQLSRNTAEIGERLSYYAEMGHKDVAVWCIMTKSRDTMALIANVTGKPCVPDENDPEGQGGTAGAGERSAVVDMLKRLYGSSHPAAKALQNWRPGGGRIPAFVATPDGHGGLIELKGR